MEKVTIVSYNTDFGVSALRSKSLIKFLKEKNINVNVISCGNSKFKWYCSIMFNIIFGSERKLYFSCGPFVYVVFFVFLVKIFNKKSVVDFRDPWSLNILTNYGNSESKKTIKYRFCVFLEKLIYFFCNYFIVCTKGMYDEYTKQFFSNKKIFLIKNGFDFNQDNSVKLDDGKFSFVCVGKFAEYDDTKAKNILLSIKNNIKIDFQIIFIGSDEEKNSTIVKECGLEKNVTFYGKLSYVEAISLTRSCDVGLLILRDEEIEYGTKIFDYIGLSMPFYSLLDKNKNFYKEFGKFLFDFNTMNLSIKSVELQEYTREEQFLGFKGILY